MGNEINLSNNLKFSKEQFKTYIMDSPYEISDDVTTFLQNEFFGKEVIRTNDKIEIEFEKFESKILKYSVKGSAPNIIDIGERGGRIFEIPQISVSFPVNADQGDYRMVGEIPYNSNLTPADRLLKSITQAEIKLSRMFTRTREKQCADLLLNGKIEMPEYSDGKLVSKRVATFDKTVRVDVSQKWDSATTDIYEQLWQYGTDLRKDTAKNLKLILGDEAYKHFVKNEGLQKILDLRNFNIGNFSPADTEKSGKYKGVAYVGRLVVAGVGIIEIYTYNARYYDEELKTNVPYIDPKVALLLPENDLGMYNFGSITVLDENSTGFKTIPAKEYTRYFTDTRKNVLELTKHSKPLPVPYPELRWKALKVVN